MLGKSLIKAAAGNVGGEVIEDLFQAWLYTGNGSTQTITNGIDLAGEGGLVWIKSRSNAAPHSLFDTARGANKSLRSNSTLAEENLTSLGINALTSFSSSGFALGDDTGFGAVNTSPNTYASWTFRKAPGFFDIVTYTGNGSNRTIPHSLGSVPGFVIVKRTDTTSAWVIYHNGLTSASYLLSFNTDAQVLNSTIWNNTAPTSTVFSVGTNAAVNASGGTYVAYLFAHDEQIFGEGGDQSVIKCGSFLSQSGNVATVELGWEPQWVLVKSATGTGSWRIIDNMRGWTLGNDAQLVAEQASAEAASDLGHPTSTGFYSRASVLAGETGIYIAIRRGPMKTPTSGTEVFLPSVTARNIEYTVGFPPDMAISKTRLTTDPNWVGDRLRGNYPTLKTESIAAEQTGFLSWTFDATTGRWKDILSSDPIQYLFRRAPGFFDVVAYTGTGAARTVAHNLGVAPELMIVKDRGQVRNWPVYSSALGNTKALFLNLANANSTEAYWNSTSPTASVFSLNSGPVNESAATYIAYLFATLPGISKCFNYTGTGTTLQIDCGFASGARLVIIKRTDSTGDWYIWDSARGIISGDDPYLLLNSTAAEVANTDYIDPYSAGFEISSTAPAAINASGGSFIGLAIA